MILLQGICIKDRKIEAMKGWLELKLIKDIQIFIEFANFYWYFIQSFSKTAALFTLMLKVLTSDIDDVVYNRRQNRFDKKISKMTKSKNTKSTF